MNKEDIENIVRKNKKEDKIESIVNIIMLIYFILLILGWVSSCSYNQGKKDEIQYIQVHHGILKIQN